MSHCDTFMKETMVLFNVFHNGKYSRYLGWEDTSQVQPGVDCVTLFKGIYTMVTNSLAHMDLSDIIIHDMDYKHYYP